MKIPIKNLYYLLSYVWNVNWEINWSSVGVEEDSSALNMLCRILITTTERILRKGLDRGYLDDRESLYGIRGRINITESIKSNGFSNSRLTCDFDELDYSVIHNKVIKTTFQVLIKTSGVDKSLKEEMHFLLGRFQTIDAIKLSTSVFSNLKLNSNNRQYRIPISICHLLYEQLLPNVDSGKFQFVELSGEKLFKIFEKFLFNFYSKHLNETSYKSIKKEGMTWQDSIIVNGNDDFLPSMETDISLFNEHSRLVIECKFYFSALQVRKFGENETSGKFISVHIYQLYAYLKNQSIKHRLPISGMIIYPENGKSISSQYHIHGHDVLIKTIDLNKSAATIHQSLINALDFCKNSHLEKEFG